MTIAGSNLRWFLSGGTGNSSPGSSLGGGISLAEVHGGINDLFGRVTGGEASTGSIKHRCVYFRNIDFDAAGLMTPVIWIYSQTTSPDTSISIGLDPAGKNGVAASITSDTDTPLGVTFSTPSSEGSGISLPSEPYLHNEYVAVWVKRIVNSGSSSITADVARLRVKGDTI